MTMQNLLNVFGHCIIPKHTLFYRGHINKSYDGCMFFATKHCVATSFQDQIQVWETTKDIEVIFLVEYVTSISKTISALPRLYNTIFSTDSNPNFDDLDIKHWDRNKRDKLVRKLFDEYNISGWLTSLENNVEMEVCLFDKATNEKQLVLVDTSSKKNKTYFKDSLQKLNIFPSKSFYSQTTEKLKEYAPMLANEQDRYKKHRRFINAGIKDYVERGFTKNEAKHYLFDLRTKLKL